MTTTKVRVSRIYTQRITDFVDVEVSHKTELSDQTLFRLAQEYVEAAVAVGKEMAWIPSKCDRVDTYRDEMFAELTPERKND